MARVPLLAANWKMHCTLPEATQLASELRQQIANVPEREVVLAPPFPVLAAVREIVAGTGWGLAGQNLHWEEKGAFTGEVSAPMLAAVGCTHVIIGHSERRQYFGETDESVARKAVAALRYKLTPIVCIGETLAERESGATLGVVRRQLEAVLGALEPDQIARIVIAYEPVWAIGTGKVATPEQAQEVHGHCREILVARGGKTVAAGVRILYGGSVKADNIDSLMAKPDIDGALVGGASLKASEFARIVGFKI